MTDKELADAVELILGFNPVDMFGDDWDTDWRVAGAVMEKCHTVDVEWHGTAYDVLAGGRAKVFQVIGESLPRAIIEACVEALK